MLTKKEQFQCFSNLIQIASYIYDLTINVLANIEKGNISNENFEKIMDKILKLKLKEKRVLNKLKESINFNNDYSYLTDIIKQTCDNSLEKFNAIHIRINNYLNLLKNNQYDNSPNTIDLYTPLQIQFFKHADIKLENKDDLIDYKYYQSFTNPNLENDLCLANYEIKNLVVFPNELIARSLNLSNEEYKNIENEVKFNYAVNSFYRFINLTSKDQIDQKLDIVYEETYYALSNLNIKWLTNFMKTFLKDNQIYNIKNKKALEYYHKLVSLTATKIKDNKEENTHDYIKPNYSNLQLNSITLAKLLETIKLAKKTYNILAELLFLEQKGEKDSKEYKQKLDILNKIHNKHENINIKLNNEDEIKNIILTMVSEYLDYLFVLENNKTITDKFELDKSILLRRISNIIFNDKIEDKSIFLNDQIPETIIKNYDVECLNKLTHLINKKKTKDTYLKFFYLQLLSDPILTKEYALLNGNFTNTIFLDDQIQSKMLNIDEDEYIYDRNILLSKKANEIINMLKSIPKEYELSDLDKVAINYNMIALDTIFKYINEDELETLKENYQNISDEGNPQLAYKLYIIFNHNQKVLSLQKNNK